MKWIITNARDNVTNNVILTEHTVEKLAIFLVNTLETSGNLSCRFKQCYSYERTMFK